MIDSHVHIFNLAYVPIRGILEAWGVPPRLADPTGRIFDRLTRVDESPSTHLDRVLLGAFASDIELATSDLVLDIARATPSEDMEAVSDAVAEAIAYLDSIGMERRNDAFHASLLIDTDLLGTERERLSRVVRAVGRRLVRGDPTLRWLLMLMNRESVLLERLLALWSGDAVFTHHMMDMDAHYPNGRSRFDFVREQMPRVRRLVEQHADRLRTFVAYCPIRPDALTVVETALSQQMGVGVKFYPPSGYKPLGNVPGDIYGHATADEVNSRNRDLFDLCVRRDAPLFAHCSPGGMERVRGKTGRYSDPKHWRRVLSTGRFASLRLCLGHAGGDEGWTAPHSPHGDAVWEGSWAREVVSLCVEYPNVYCEFGHVDAVLDEHLRSKFQRRLERVIEATASAPYPFASKVMFGSDWHLVSRVRDHHELARVWRTMFRSSPILAPWEHAMLSANAVEYLGLPISKVKSGVRAPDLSSANG
jgi:predicted TIM-barrel fold metal-dependent hydrolase